MTAYVVRRCGTSVIILIGISIFTFGLLHIVYPSPARVVLGPRASLLAINVWNQQHGFAGSVFAQYWHYVDGVLHGNFGYSFKLNQSVTALFNERWMLSAYLSGTSLVLPVLIAISLLKSHGWTINTSGTDTCARAGTGPTDCGAGIPAGTQLAFNLIYESSPADVGEQCTAFASAAASAGITIHLSTATYNYIITYYDDPVPTGKSYINKWAMEDWGGFTDSTYPTQLGVFNGPGSLNEGDYNNPQANALINASVSSGNPAAVKAEASFLTANQPGLFQPNPDLVAVWRTNISGPTASFASLTQYGLDAEYWWFTG